MGYLDEHYEKEKQKYSELAEAGSEAFIAYYKERFPDRYKILFEAEEKIEKLRQYGDRELFVVQSGWNGDARLWWRHDNRGYTVDLQFAQTYTKAEMIKWLLKGFKASDKIWSYTHVMDSAIKVSHSQFTNPKYLI
jgi:hypothetical protein